MKEPITTITISMHGTEDSIKISTSRYINIKEADGKNSVDRIQLAIIALKALQTEYADEQAK